MGVFARTSHTGIWCDLRRRLLRGRQGRHTDDTSARTGDVSSTTTKASWFASGHDATWKAVLASWKPIRRHGRGRGPAAKSNEAYKQKPPIMGSGAERRIEQASPLFCKASDIAHSGCAMHKWLTSNANEWSRAQQVDVRCVSVKDGRVRTGGFQ